MKYTRKYNVEIELNEFGQYLVDLGYLNMVGMGDTIALTMDITGETHGRLYAYSTDEAASVWWLTDNPIDNTDREVCTWKGHIHSSQIEEGSYGDF